VDDYCKLMFVFCDFLSLAVNLFNRCL
jgi:hypothetical protein